MTTTYAKGPVQAPLSEQVTQTSRKVTKAAPRASSIAGTIARSAVEPGPGLPTRTAKRVIRVEQPFIDPDLKIATSRTISGVGVGSPGIASPQMNVDQGVGQSSAPSSSITQTVVNIHGNLSQTLGADLPKLGTDLGASRIVGSHYPGWVRVLIWTVLPLAVWAAIIALVGYGLSVGVGS